MGQQLKIVGRSATDALKFGLRKHEIDMPQGFWENALRDVIQALMEIEVSQLIDASRYERNGVRRAYRNGYRDSAWLMNQRSIPLRIPKLRSGSYYPSFLDHPHSEKIITEMVLWAYLYGVSYHAIADSLLQLGIDAHPSHISNLEEDLYDLLDNLKSRDLNPSNVQLDILPIEDQGRTRYLALAFDDDELLHHDITTQADEAFWQDFVRRLDGRVVSGVEYVVVSRVHTVVRVADPETPQMLLVA